MRGKCQGTCKPGSVSPPCGQMGDHSSRRRIAPPLKRPTRATSRNRPICHPYSVLHPVGFAVPSLLPAARCALAAPFRPYLLRRPAVCFLWHFPWPGRTATAGRYPAPSFRGARTFLASHRCKPRPPGPLTLRAYRSIAGAGATATSSLARHSPSTMPSIVSGRKRRWKAITALSGRRSRHSRTVRARAGSRRRSRTGRSGRGSGLAARGGGWRAPPTGTVRPDLPCAPGRCPNGRRHCRGRCRAVP